MIFGAWPKSSTTAAPARPSALKDTSPSAALAATESLHSVANGMLDGIDCDQCGVIDDDRRRVELLPAPEERVERAAKAGRQARWAAAAEATS